ncbi:phage tail tape measure protein [Fusicatenibacter saccharivorans]|uniref:phage tail tape measure protein n=1 Tax=Fusicatenibacter saccharivorans TaxID=1150298 RepID=UPI0032BFF3B1
MAEDFKIKIEADLDTEQADQKIEKLVNKKRTIKLDVDINGQNAKSITDNIQKGLSKTKLDTSNISKQIADSFNISDKGVISKIQTQLNEMMTSLSKTWNGKNFDFKNASGFYSGMEQMAKTVTENARIIKSATGVYDDFYNYFNRKKIYVSDELKNALGTDQYKELLNNNIGKIVRDATKGVSIDSIWGEMSNLFPEHFSENITNQVDQILYATNLLKKARADMDEVFTSSNMTAQQKGEINNSAYAEVLEMSKNLQNNLQKNIVEATEAAKTTIKIDVQLDKEKIAADIRNAIESASSGAGEAIKLNLDINEEQLLSNLQSAIRKLTTGDESVKVEIDVDKSDLQSKLNEACKEMQIPVQFKIDADEIASQIKAAVDKITDIELDLKVNTNSVKQSVDDAIKDKIEPEVDPSGITQLQNILQNVNGAGRQSQSIFQSLGSTFKDAFSAYSAANLLQDAIYKIGDAGREVIGTVRELNDSLVSLQMATGDDYDTVKNLMHQYNTLGQELGAITTDVASGADAWLRQGKSLEQTNTLLKDSIVLSKVSGLDAEESTQYLTAAMNGYNVAVDNVMGIVDKVSKVDLESATDAGGLMEAMSRVSTMANTAGVNMDKLLGYMASVGEIMQPTSMSTLGTAFKSIFARMSDIKAQNYELVDDDGTVQLLSDVESSLKKVGIDLRKTVTEYNSYADVLDNLAAKWNTLNQVQQNELAKAFAGTRQQEVFRTLMEHYDRAQKYAEVAENSAGTAEKKFQDNYLSSLEAKTNALKASFESLSSSLVSDDMYSWALDGAKAVTDFAEKTNILKGAIAGLGTAGSLYAVKQLVLGFGSAVQEFSNLGKAMSMLKTGTGVTSNMSQLLELTQGLSKSQTALILSSTELNTAQRTAILMNRGMSESEAEAELATMGLSAAEGTATATTMSLGSAMKGMVATLAANPIFLLTTAVTVGVAAWQSYNQSVEESIQHTKDSTAELQERNQSLDDNIQKVQELRDSLDSGTLTEQEAYNTKSQLLDIQSQLSDSYGEQADGIDLVNGKLDEQIEKMQQLKVENAKSWLNDSDNEKNYEKAKKKMTKDDYESFFGNTPTLSMLGAEPTDKDALKRYKNNKAQIEEIQKAAEQAGLKKYNGQTAGQFQLGFENETVTGADEKLNNFLATVKELKRQFQDEGKNTDYFDNIISSAEDAESSYKDILDKHQEIYQEYLKNSMLAEGYGNNKPATVYQQYADAVDKYNEALQSGDTSKVKAAKTALDGVKASVDNIVSTNSGKKYKELFDEITDGIDAASEKTYEFKERLSGRGTDKLNNTVLSKLKELKNYTDIDLKSINLDTSDVVAGKDALRMAVNEAMDLGIVSDDSAESVAKVVDLLTDMGMTATVSMDQVDDSFSEVNTTIQQAQANLETLKTIMSESVSGAGISADNVKAFREMFGDDAERALEKTADGYHINREELAKLQAQQSEMNKADYLSGLADQQEALRQIEEQIADAMVKGQDVSGLQSQRQSILDNISSLEDLAYQYQTATSAYQQWQDAMSGGEEGDMYDSIQGNMESIKDLYDKGLVGENKFREFVDLMSNKDLTNASVDEIVAAYEESYPKMERYFTEGQEGCQAFLQDVSNLNSEWAHMNEDGSWEINFGVGNDQEIADALGIDVEAVQALMRKMHDFGADINLDQPVKSLEQLKTEAQSAKEALDGMGETSLDSINLDTDSFSEITDDIDKVKEYIQQINDADLEPEIRTERLEQANNILDYLVQKQHEAGQNNIVIDADASSVDQKISDLKSQLEQFRNEDGTIPVNADTQDAVNSLQSLYATKQNLENTPAILQVDTSQVDGELGNAIGKLQEYQNAVEILNAQNTMKTQGIDIDTTDAQQKVQQLAGQLQNLDADTTAKLGLDDTDFQSKLSNIATHPIDVGIGVNLDPNALADVSTKISGITPELLVKAGVNEEAIVNYTPKDKDATVKYKVNHSAIDSYDPEDKNATVTYSVVVSGLENLPGNKTRSLTYNIKTNGMAPKVNGTAHAIGTAHAAGTASRNWGLTHNEPHALVNELKPEAIVRDGKAFILNGGDPTFANLKKDDVVFNGDQTEQLLEHGYVTGSHAQLAGGGYSLGSAFSSGTWKPNPGSSGTKADSSTWEENQKKDKTGSKSSSGSSSSRNSGSSSGGSTRSSSGGSSGGSSGSSSTKEATEETFDWIEVFLKEMSRATEIAVDNIDRAIGLAQKQTKAYDAISKVQQELTANQQSANKYLQLAANMGLDPSYISKIQNGTLDVEKVTNEDLKKKIDEYKDYYSKYESAADNVAKLEDKITELAEKRLEIITDTYDAIVDINDSIKSVADSKISLNDALGVAIDNPDNYASINKSIKAQEDTYNQLTKKLAEYQKEMDSQLSSGLMKKGSDAYNSALKNIQDFTAKIYDASTSLLELRDKLDQIKIDTIQNAIDGIKRNSDITEKYISYLQSQNRDVPENLYTDRIDNNNAQVQQNLKQMEIYRQKQAVLDVNSKSYQDYAEKIQTLKENTLELITDNESLQDSIYELRFKPLDDAIQKYSDLEDELKSFRDLLNDDAFLDKQGRITEEGLAQVALLQQSIGTAKQKIADYTTGLQKLKESYDNGVISLTEYNDKSKDYREGIQGSIADVKSYQDSLVDLYKNAMSTEVDYLDKIIKKRQESLNQQKTAYEFQKKVDSQSNDINKLKAQYEAIRNSNNISDQSTAKKLKQQIADAEKELSETKRDHAYDMQSQGFDKLSSDLQETLDNTEYEISHNADKQLEIINSMLDKAVSSYQEAYGKINSIIKNTGWVGSTDFNNTQSDLSTETGVKNQNSNASQSQSIANKNPSSTASGTKTDPINSNSKVNSDLADQLVKPEDTTNRKVAELKVSPTSTTLEEGKSTSITATIRPNDATNKTLAWKSSNESIATVSNGTVKAKKPGSCTITATTTDGSGLSAKVSIKVNAKPKPPKPQPKPQPAKTGGDGIPRVGDVVTFTGSYYNDSWGMSPKGSRFSGQPGAVVIDSYTAREYGGNGRTTGDFKIHIKSAHDPNYSDLGWVRLSQISGYEKGTDRIHGDQLVWTNENKDTKHHGVSELIYRKKDGAVLTPVQDGDSILPADFVSNLAALSAIDPREFGMNVSTTPNLVQTNIPQNISNVGNVTVTNHYDALLNVEGNVDRDALPGLQKILEKSYTYTTKKLADEYGRLGHKIIM